MPRIPGPQEFARIGAPRPAVADTTADDRALQSVGDTVLQIGSVLKERRQTAIDSGANAQFITERRSNYTRIFNETPIEGEEPYPTRLQRELDKYEDELFDSVRKGGYDYSRDEEMRQKARAAQLKADFLTKAVTVENSNYVAKVERQAGETAQQLSMAAFNNPDGLNGVYADIEDAYTSYASVPGVTQEAIADSISKAKNNATVSAVRGLNNTDPTVSLSRLNEGVYDSNLTAEQKNALIDEANSAIRRNRTNNQSRFSAAIKDEVVALRRTGNRAGAITDEQIEEIFPETASQIFEQFRLEKQTYDDSQAIAFATPQEVREIIASRAPEGLGFADEAERQDILLEKARERFETLGIGTEKPGDPVGYILDKSPDLAEDLSAKDPAVVRNATSAVVDMQRRLGVPESRIRVLSNGRAKQIVTQLEGMKAEDRPGFLASVQNTYEGEDGLYRIAFSQMVDAGLSAESMVLAANVNDPLLSQQLATLIDIDTRELRGGIETATLNDIGQSVIDNTAEFFSAFQAGDFTGGAIPIIDKWQSVIEKLAILKYKQTGDAGAAVSEAVKQIIDDNYAVLRSGNPGEGRGINAYIPRDLDGKSISPMQVEQVAADRQRIDLIREFDPKPIGDPSSPNFISKERIIRSAARSGFWVTNEQGDGLMLMAPLGNGVYLPVVNKDDQRYGVGFIEAMGARLTSEQQTQAERDARLFPTKGL